MSKCLKDLKAGDLFKTKRGWWVKITRVFADKIEGFFATDRTSLDYWVARYPAIWNRNDGQEITNPQSPCDWLSLELADC